MVKSILPVWFICGALSGCGIYQIHNEADHYHDELAEKAASTFRDCRDGKQTSMTQNRKNGPPDCFDLVVKESPKRIGVKPSTTPLRDGDKQVLPAPKDAYAHIDQFAMMAMFSRMVYHRYDNLADRNNEAACTSNLDRHPLNYLYAGSSANGRWRLWNDGKQGCYANSGLYYETYVYYPKADDAGTNRYTRAVIVFRGTENYQSEFAADWGSNIASAFGIKPQQYAAASERLDQLTRDLRAQGAEDLEIYATGHSLGGGLAQMTAYWSRDIKAAYAFNATPVTG